MVKVKTWLRRAVCGIVFIAILAAMVLRLDSGLKLIQEDNLCPRYYDYPKDTFDVTFLGSSFGMYAIYPMELYRDFGIASYNLCTGNQSIEASYYLARESIEKDHPSLIVMDCNMAWIGQETMQAEYIHYITDTMPYLSGNRLEIIRSLSEEGEDQLPLLFPLVAYHSRWQELTYEDFLPQAKELVYGCKVQGRVEVAKPFKEPKKVEGLTLPDVSLNYLNKIVELCKENDTELLLMNIPVLGKNKFFDQAGYNTRWTAAQEVKKFAEQNDVPYLDYFGKWEEMGFRIENEAMDGEHFNRWGAGRFTKILGNYMKEHYDLPDRRGSGGAYAVIDRDAENYPVNRMRDSLRRSLFLRDYAATLKSDVAGAEGEPVEDALVLVSLHGLVDDKILTEDQAKLLQECGFSQDLSKMTTHSWLAVVDGGKVVYETVPGSEDSMDSYEGTIGKLDFTVTSGRIEEETGRIRSDATITVNGLEYTMNERGLHFAVFEKSTGKLMDQCWLNIFSEDLNCTHDYH